MSPEVNPNVHVLRRRVAKAVGNSTMFRSEQIAEAGRSGLSDFEDKIFEGYGGIIVLKHFSLKDPPQVIMDIIFSNPVLIGKEVLVPNAEHQIYPGVQRIVRLFGIKIDPIVTENTVKRAIRKGKKRVPELNKGSAEFVRDAVDYLKRGQLVVIAPEGQRKPDIEPYGNNSIGVLLGTARLARANVALLFIDLRVAGPEHSYWDRTLFNPLARYEVRIGRCLTSEEIVVMANGRFREIDEKVIVPEMQRTAAIPRPSPA